MSTLELRIRHLALLLLGFWLLMACLFVIGFRTGRLARARAERKTRSQVLEGPSGVGALCEFLDPECAILGDCCFEDEFEDENLLMPTDRQMVEIVKLLPRETGVHKAQWIQGDMTAILVPENSRVACDTNHNDFGARMLSDFIRPRLRSVSLNYPASLQQLESDFIYPKQVEKAIGEFGCLCHDQMPDEWLHLGVVSPGKMPELRK